ncbi:MAG: methyltransferase domain-containing protein [Candidatus Yanofskybacteria bacterium]|nr:methyltransferase domain-containing protein [Candidatus Yanofskybacteria bacterium]
MSNKITERKTCRISGEKLIGLFSLGKLHVSNFLPLDDDVRLEPVELKLCLAPKSGLVQLAHSAPTDYMYTHYWYRSGTNASMTNELKQIAEPVQNQMSLKKGDVFIDIGCNDGTLFKFVDPRIIRVGFDPTKNVSEEAKKHASLVIQDYFNYAAYKKSRYGNKKAKVVTSIAMFYDLENPHIFVKNIHKILEKDGLWVIQMSYLPLMLKQLAFDNICHEHLEYYTLTSLKHLLDSHDFQIVDCQLNDVNGGSFRVYVRKNRADPTKFATAPYRDVALHRVESILAHEKTLGLGKSKTYSDFYQKINDLKIKTVNFIKQERGKGKTTWGYGASTKGNTLLQWFGLDNTLIEGIAERSPKKFGHKTVGTNIPIYSEEEMRKRRPDYLLILPWHFISEFKARESAYLKAGGKIIVPCPKFEIISN